LPETGDEMQPDLLPQAHQECGTRLAGAFSAFIYQSHQKFPLDFAHRDV